MILAGKHHIFSRTINRVVSSSLGGTRCCRTVHLVDNKLVTSSQWRIQFSSSKIRPRSTWLPSTYWGTAAPWITTAIVGCAWAVLVPNSCLLPTRTTTCDVAVVDNDDALLVKLPTVDAVDTKKSVRETLQRIFRLFKRLLKLTIALSPIVALYPLHYLLTKLSALPELSGGDGTDAHQVALASLVEIPNGQLNWYYRLCLYCVEWSGAAAIKFMQWAGSRPDMFGSSFCAVFSQLQDDTTPHAWKYTERALRDAYGENWQEHIRLDEILGSGCIAQVYKGIIYDNDSGQEQQVAVKVMHPNVEDDIDADLDIMRLVTHIVDFIPMDVFRNLKWMNLPGIVEEMSRLLKIQLDLRTEADHLVRFNQNFKDNDVILFPKLVDGYEPTKEVLIETFCPGEPIMEFIRNNKEDQGVLTEMCTGAIRAVCQMIFLDNFVHGDLHPGNVLVNQDKKFVLLDVGIVVENNKKDHRLISDVLAAFIRMNGREAGRRMIEDSNARLVEQHEYAINEGLFLDTIENLTIRASGKDYFMEHLGAYITIICNAAATHHIMLNPAFVSAALAVKVQEGIALALDPSIQIWRIAIPIILEGERRNGYVVDRAKEIMGWERVMEWLRGTAGSSRSKESTKL